MYKLASHITLNNDLSEMNLFWTNKAVERNDQLRRFITFFRRLFYKIYTTTLRITIQNDIKIKYK